MWSRSLSRSLHWCTPSNPSTISPIEILSSDLLVELNEFGQYWRRCVERCDWIFQAILLTSTVRWAWIHDGHKSGWAPALAVGVFKKESIYNDHHVTNFMSKDTFFGHFGLAPLSIWAHPKGSHAFMMAEDWLTVGFVMAWTSFDPTLFVMLSFCSQKWLHSWRTVITATDVGH